VGLGPGAIGHALTFQLDSFPSLPFTVVNIEVEI
jgi:hypothetical protein